jgi:acetyl esterase/lipase
MKRLVLLITICILSLGMTPRSEGIVNAQYYLNQSYGPHKRHKMDVYLPATRKENTPTVVLIHGGAWVIGSKNSWPAEVINGLVQQGFAVACINYRYACGDFHAQMDDIQSAIDYLRSKSTEWQTGNANIGLAGVSAGAHLSLLFAHKYDYAHQVKAVVSLAGPTDLGDTLLHQYLKRHGINFVIKHFLGTTDAQVSADASPGINPGKVPTLFINGDRDKLIPAEQSLRMFNILTANTTPADTTVLHNTGHNIFGPRNVNIPQLSSELNRWMEMYLQ